MRTTKKAGGSVVHQNQLAKRYNELSKYTISPQNRTSLACITESPILLVLSEMKGPALERFLDIKKKKKMKMFFIIININFILCLGG
jgi:hypothetical protein